MSRLNRATAEKGAAAPVRAVHLGLGGFHRAHQAWYTNADPEWGIAAYTFQNTELPRRLTEQDGLYTLFVYGESEPTTEIVTSISRAHPGTDTQRWLADLASPEVALITLTVTEAAYRVPDTDADSALFRLIAGLRERFRANRAPIAVVPCDNVPNNGTVLRSALREMAARHAPELSGWIEDSVSVVDTVVDRITPTSTEADQRTVSATTGLDDLVPVVTEPFSEWLIAGTFPLGRPHWEGAGAQLVDRVEAYQERKLWFLNGAHTLLAYVGLARGHATVREAVQDGELRALIDSWWDTAGTHSALSASQLNDYRERLLSRFATPGIRHRLQQIAADGSQKIPARIVPVLRLERERGRLPPSAVTGLAAWLVHLREGEVNDAGASELVPLARAGDSAARVLAALDSDLASDAELTTAIETERKQLRAATQAGNAP